MQSFPVTAFLDNINFSKAVYMIFVKVLHTTNKAFDSTHQRF